MGRDGVRSGTWDLYVRPEYAFNDACTACEPRDCADVANLYENKFLVK